jgi:hypothetical protein
MRHLKWNEPPDQLQVGIFLLFHNDVPKNFSVPFRPRLPNDILFSDGMFLLKRPDQQLPIDESPPFLQLSLEISKNVIFLIVLAVLALKIHYQLTRIWI